MPSRIALALILSILLALPSLAQGPTLGPERACFPGQSLAVSGANVPPNTALLLSWGGRIVGGGVADRVGRYSLFLNVGQERGGSYEVAVLTRDGREVLQRFLCVIPGGSVSPTTGQVTAGVPTAPIGTPRPTSTTGPTPITTPTPPQFVEGQCDPSYPDFCIALFTGVDNINCQDVLPWTNFKVHEPDPYELDGGGIPGVGCEE